MSHGFEERVVHMPASQPRQKDAKQLMAEMKEKVSAQLMKAVSAKEKMLDEQIDELDNLSKGDLEQIRRKRVIEMKKRAKKMAEWRLAGHGTYQEISDEKDWFACSKGSERTVTLFYRRTSTDADRYTDILDKHLSVLAAKHLETRFMKINAERAPYLAQKLLIVLLPTIMCTKDNYTHDRIEGFDPLGGREDFTTQTLRARLGKKGTIFYDPMVDKPMAPAKRELYNAAKTNKLGRAIYQSKIASLDDDDDWDDISD